jgi:hypothetical protein
VTVSAWSHEGPCRERRGFESVVQNVSGITDDYRFDGQPRLMPANTIDYGTGYLGAFGAMVALGRRAREGGSYLVRVALARTGRWITHYPHVSKDEQSRVQPIPPERGEQLMVSTETPFGRLRHLGPVVEMSERRPSGYTPRSRLTTTRPCGYRLSRSIRPAPSHRAGDTISYVSQEQAVHRAQLGTWSLVRRSEHPHDHCCR